jgi:serine protease inhibitor
VRRTKMIVGVLAIGMLLAGCGTDAPSDGAGSRSEESGPAPDERTADPDEAPAVELVADLDPVDAQVVGEAVNEFGFDLLGQLTDGTENTVTSPLSVATLLAMVLAGAGGDTAAAMADVLHLDDPRDVRVGALLDTLADTDEVTLKVANALFAQDGVPFEPDYVDFVTDTFGAALDEVDLGDPQTAEQIDTWVREHTGDLIDGIAEDLGLPDPDIVLVLLNAVYFLGEWTTQFDPGDTQDEPFTLGDGSQVDVPLMHLRVETFGHTERDDYRMIRLPYGEDGRYGMEILLPDEDTDLAAVLGGVDAAEWRAAVDSLADIEISDVAVPKFELEWDAELAGPLAQLGMGDAFTRGADFRPMSPADLWLDTVVHKTYIRVDEEGTEAAAVTGGGMRATSIDVEALTFIVDRPFAFTISDTETGTILFLGSVTDPRG